MLQQNIENTVVERNFIPLYTQMDAVYIFYIPSELN